jgi:hypothetical protein
MTHRQNIVQATLIPCIARFPGIVVLRGMPGTVTDNATNPGVQAEQYLPAYALQNNKSYLLNKNRPN